MKKPYLSGIVPPLVTPLTDRDTLDVAGFERLIDRVIQGGVGGIFILGTTGEGVSLSYRLRREVISTVCRQVRGRVPVLVGITDTAFMESVNLARHAAEAGATALVAAPPYYLPPGQPELIEYIRNMLPELPLPLFLYNMPALTKVKFDMETVRVLSDEPGIHGIKDSSCDMIYFHFLCRTAAARPDWSVLMGPDEMLVDAVMAGGHGGVNGGANLFPELYVAVYQAACAGDMARARALHHHVLNVSSWLYRVGQHSSSIIKGIKCALSIEGVCSDFMAEPCHRFRSEEHRKVEKIVAELKAGIRTVMG